MLSVLEGERRRVTLDDALALCRGLGVTLPDLLEGASEVDRSTLGI
jgi:DNA-binding Xre family transcriptional regulator